MFTLDESLAREWLTLAIVAYEFDAEPACSEAVAGEERLSIGMAWDPRAPGQEDIVRQLVRAAQREPAVIGCPDGAMLDVEYLDDGDDWCVRFVLAVAAPAPLLVAGPPQLICRLGNDAPCGIEAALRILDQAVEAGNLLLMQLAVYVSTATSPN